MASVVKNKLHEDYFETSFMLNDVLKTASLKLRPVRARNPLPPVKQKRGSECNEKVFSYELYEPHHDKTNIMGLRPAWIQTSLRIRAV
jgi:hypothetical protein